jgi:hypothetical protein
MRCESRQVFEAIPVTDLPLPHNPYQCKYHDRFKVVTRDYRWAEGAREFVASLTIDEVKGCQYHQANWAAIADESVRVVEVVGPLRPAVYYIHEARRSSLGGGDPSRGGDLRWLLSLFETPVIIDGGGYTDGQQRGCALRFSGAKRAVVVTRYETLR